ncbi:MAG TPA: restriction endonuclease [Ktedonobacteraceae bacterium]|nr:restriction endonuclease [Ktedonobacteraceae bacterium]
MARRSRLVSSRVQKQREAERRLREQERLQTQAARAAEKARKDYERAVAADQKERARLYIESRQAQVVLQNEQLEQQIHSLEHLLLDALAIDPFISMQSLKQPLNIPAFNAGPLGIPEPPPQWQRYMPPEPGVVQKLLPGAKEKHAQAVMRAQETYRTHIAAHANREGTRQQALAHAKAQYDHQARDEQQRIAVQHAEIDAFQRDFQAGLPQAVIDYFAMVLASSAYPDGFPQKVKLAYVPESKQLVVEYDLPAFDVVPGVSLYKYVKAKDGITETVRPLAQRKTLYASIIAQISLRTLSELFRADRMECLDMVVFNGYTASINKGTGQSIRTCLVTVRTSRNIFMGLNLSQVDPQACLAVLNASVSKSPSELAPVRPVLEFSMVDQRFIEEIDVLSELDQRPNLMELTPFEFESLITNLFQKMGLEARQTQASRDGGVDCVAYDPRPIFGGKVVIQAKRYKNTVGVSAVRDLYGTVQNEGASKGILVTTSGYGKASFEFAEGKPLELLSGSNLLYLLKEHAGIDAKIEMPEGWKDPQPDM